MNLLKRLLLVLAATAALLACFLLVARPWYLRWGATDDELTRALPGDEIVPGASGETRAITIQAPVAVVWAWVAQTGQDRGGFYSFDLLENLVGCEMTTEDRLRPGKGDWAIGDRLWMYPPDKAGGVGYATLRVLVPGRALAFGTHAIGTSLDAPEDGSWAFVVEPIDATSSRLIMRGRGPRGRSLLGLAFDRTVFEPMHFAMERRMMIGIKQLAEGADRGRVLNHVHVVLWAVTFVLVAVAKLMVLFGRRVRRSLIGFLAGAIVFQILTLLQPAPAFGVVLVAAVAVIVLGRSSQPTAAPARAQPRAA